MFVHRVANFLVVTVSPPIDLFSCHLPQVHRHGPLYKAFSDVTPPLHQHLTPFTTNGTILPRNGALLTSDGAFSPRDGALLTSDGAFLPRDGALLTSDGAFLPRNGALLTSDGAFLPRDGALLPP